MQTAVSTQIFLSDSRSTAISSYQLKFYFGMSIGTAARDRGITEERGESVVRANEGEDGKSAVAADVVLLDRPQWVGGFPASC